MHLALSVPVAHRALRVATLAVAVAIGTGACRAGLDDRALRAAMNSALQDEASDRDLSASMNRWYAARDYRLAWDDDDDVDVVKAILNDTASHGLNPEWYDLPRIEAARAARRGSKARDAERARLLANLDVAVTSSLMRAGRDVATGRIRPGSLDHRWKAARTPPDLASTLDSALARGRLSSWLDQIAPHHPEYAQLRA